MEQATVIVDRKSWAPTLKDSSKFSPPQISKPGSYKPNLTKNSLLIENSPPAMVGDLKERWDVWEWRKEFYPRETFFDSQGDNLYWLDYQREVDVIYLAFSTPMKLRVELKIGIY